MTSFVMRDPGDEITFLKRRHFQPKKTPAHPELDANDGTPELDTTQAGIYRSAVGHNMGCTTTTVT